MNANVDFQADFAKLNTLLRDHARKHVITDVAHTAAARESRILRIVPIQEVEDSKWYSDMAALAVIFNHEVVETNDNVWRWKQNGIVDFALSGICGMHEGEWNGHMSAKYFRGAINLNDLWGDFYRGAFTCEELMKFYMGIGYSLSGYAEVFGQKEATELNLPGARQRTDADDEDNYVQTPLEYMAEKYKDQVLKL